MFDKHESETREAKLNADRDRAFGKWRSGAAVSAQLAGFEADEPESEKTFYALLRDAFNAGFGSGSVSAIIEVFDAVLHDDAAPGLKSGNRTAPRPH